MTAPWRCKSCGTLFVVQPDECVSCGSRKLYDKELRGAWADNERLRAELMAVCQREAASAARHDAKLDALEHEIRNLTNRIEQLREALAFYADRETWRGDQRPIHSDVDGDFRATPGKRARAVLKDAER